MLVSLLENYNSCTIVHLLKVLNLISYHLVGYLESFYFTLLS